MVEFDNINIVEMEKQAEEDLRKRAAILSKFSPEEILKMGVSAAVIAFLTDNTGPKEFSEVFDSVICECARRKKLGRVLSWLLDFKRSLLSYLTPRYVVLKEKLHEKSL